MESARAVRTETETEAEAAAAATATEAGGGVTKAAETEATKAALEYLAAATAAGASPPATFLQIGRCLSGAIETVTCKRKMATACK